MNNKTKNNNIGAGPRIRKWRKSRGMKSMDLAKVVNLSQGSLSDIENGKSNPSAWTIVAFINHTDINVFWMLTGKFEEINKGEIGGEMPLVLHVSPGSEFLIRGGE